MIDFNTEVLIDITKEATLSDWLEQQPLERWFSHSVCGKGRCAWGLIADFLGFGWSEMADSIEPYTYIRKLLGQDFSFVISPFTYDEIYDTEGPQAAKDYTIRRLRTRGL